MPYKDPTIARAYHKAWKRRNAWRYADRQRATDSARHANERAAKYGRPGQLTIDQAFELFAASSGCHYCGKSETWLGLDHVVPLHGGGTNTLDNIVVACHSCNASKWRQDRPFRWSRDHEACAKCGRTARKHICHGLCQACYISRQAAKAKAARALRRTA